MPRPWRLLHATFIVAAVMAACGCEDEPPLVDDLREGGHVLVLRHAATGMATDQREFLSSCSLQRNLSRAGREQARAIGAAMRELDIPIGEVRTSPMCRAHDTAVLAFGRATIDADLVSPGVVDTVEEDERRALELRDLVSESPADGTNTVLVTHTGNIGAALDESIEEGEMLAYADGRLAGRIKPDEWPEPD
jgi:phosphohistidine phosphatase SixA